MKYVENLKAIKPNTLITAGIFIVIVLVVWKVWKMFFKKDDGVESAEKEIKKNNLTYSESNYQTYADRIENAGDNGGWPGTDEDAIYQVFREMKTKDDILQLIISFGERNYWENTWFYPAKFNLSKTLYSELDNSEIEEINNIISGNGINYKF